MANPILDGIRTGASLVNASTQLAQQKWRDQVSADQFDRKLSLSRDMFDNEKSRQQRSDSTEIGRVTNSRKFELRRKYDKLKDSGASDEELASLGNEWAAVHKAGMGDKLYRTAYEAAGHSKYGDPTKEPRKATALDTEGDDPLDIANFTRAPATYTRADGKVINKGDLVLIMGDSQGNALTEAQTVDDVTPNNEGTPFAMTIEEAFEMDDATNEFFQSQAGGLYKGDKRADEITTELQDLSQPHLQSQADLRTAGSNLARFDRENPNLFDKGEPGQKTKTDLAGNTVDPLDTKSNSEVGQVIYDYQEKSRMQDALINKEDTRMDSMSLKGGTIKIPKNYFSDKQSAVSEASNLALELNKTGLVDGTEAVTQQLGVVNSELERVEKKGLAGGYSQSEREQAKTYRASLLENKRQLELAQGKQPTPDTGPNAIKESDVDTPKKAKAALIAERDALEAAYRTAETTAEKASLGMKHAHIAALVKLGVSPTAKDITNIMNNGGASYAEMARASYQQQTFQHKSRAERAKMLKERHDDVYAYLDKIVSEVPSNQRAGSPQAKYRQAVGASRILDNPNILFDRGDVDLMMPYYLEVANYADSNDYPPLDIAKVNMSLQGHGLKGDKDDDEWAEFIKGYSSQMTELGERIGRTGMEVMTTIDANMGKHLMNTDDPEAALMDAIEEFQAKLNSGQR